MKKILLFIGILGISFSSQSQTWEWVKNYNFDATDWGSSIGIDKEKNIYVIGNSNYFTGGGGSRIHEWFCKFDSTGNLLWKDTLDFIQAKSVTNNDGYTYIAGDNKILKFNENGIKLWQINVPATGPLVSMALHPLGGVVVLSSKLSDDLSTFKSVLARYDQNGACLWVKVGLFPLADKVTCDRIGNTYIVGTGSTDTTTINFGMLTICDINGDILSKHTIPHSPTDIAVDSQMNIYVTGWFSIYGIEINGTEYPGDHTKEFQFLVKYTQQGNVLWHKVYNQGRHTIAIDAEDNLYAAFYYNGNIPRINVQPGNLVVMKTDSVGNIAWYKNSQVIIPPPGYLQGYVEAYNMVVKNNDVYLTGAMTGTQTFGNYTLTSNNSYTDVFLAKIAQANAVSVKEIYNQEFFDFNVFPNPTVGLFKVRCNLKEKCAVQLNVINSKGQKILSEQHNQQEGEFLKEIDLSKHAKGIYFIEIVADTRPEGGFGQGKKAIRKIVVD